MPNKWLFVIYLTSYLKKQCDKWKCYYTAISQVGVNNCVCILCVCLFIYLFFIIIIIIVIIIIIIIIICFDMKSVFCAQHKHIHHIPSLCYITNSNFFDNTLCIIG